MLSDPLLAAKVSDIVGLYRGCRSGPPKRAAMLCVDEPSQIQALERTQPGLPLKKGRAATSCWKHAFGMMVLETRLRHDGVGNTLPA